MGRSEVTTVQPMTKRQEAILEFIRKSIRERGYPPTLREIGAPRGIRSTNGVSDHLRALERKGHLRREDMKSRALRPVCDEEPENDDVIDPPDVLSVPLVGRVAAGGLTEAVEHIEKQIMMDPSLLKGGGETFALKVRGDSMIEAGINDGDILFVRRQSSANKGEIVVALVGDEATVKRYYPERDAVRLQPENHRMTPIIVPRRELSSFRILGLAVGLFRTVASNRMA
jgi:repressor LexA